MNDEELLIHAWIDGELAPEKALQAAMLAAAKPELQLLSEQLLQLQKLNLAEAYQQSTPEMPTALQASLQKTILQNEGAKSEPSEEPVQTEAAAANRVATFAKVAAVVLSIGLGYGLANLPPAEHESALATWSDTVLTYQHLYLRETVTDTATSAQQATMLIENNGLTQALVSIIGKDVSAISPLNEKGYNFSRAQILGYKNSKLLQMVYLADEGLPLAFCVMPLSGEDTLAKISTNSAKGVNASYWRHAGFAYVLVGSLPGDEIDVLAQSLQRTQGSQG